MATATKKMHGADRIPVVALDHVKELLKSGDKSGASQLLDSLCVKYKLFSFEAHQLAAHLLKETQCGAMWFLPLTEADQAKRAWLNEFEDGCRKAYAGFTSDGMWCNAHMFYGMGLSVADAVKRFGEQGISMRRKS